MKIVPCQGQAPLFIVPPPLERFLHDDTDPYPALVKAALAHVQFEIIHPFLDGNGRIGRLLIAFILHHDDLLSQPLLYLCLYFEQHRSPSITACWTRCELKAIGKHGWASFWKEYK